jgi:hypothetical protein
MKMYAGVCHATWMLFGEGFPSHFKGREKQGGEW